MTGKWKDVPWYSQKRNKGQGNSYHPALTLEEYKRQEEAKRLHPSNYARKTKAQRYSGHGPGGSGE